MLQLSSITFDYRLWGQDELNLVSFFFFKKNCYWVGMDYAVHLKQSLVRKGIVIERGQFKEG